MCRRGPWLLLLLLTAPSCSTSTDALREKFMASGDAYFAKKQYQEAAIQYRNAIQQNPQYGPARLKLADTFRLLDDPNGAYREYLRAADLMPQNVEAQVRAAQYLLAASRFDDARIRVDKALELAPKNVDALIVKGATLAQMKNLDSAVAQILQAIEIDPTRPAGYTSLGSLETARGDLVEAERAFKQAVALKPDSVSARVMLANFYWNANRAADAEAALREAATLSPNDQDVNRSLALVLAGTNRQQEAERYLKAVADAAQDSPSRLALAAFYARNHRTKDAVALLDTVASTDRTSAGRARTMQAQLEYDAGDPAAAHKVLDELIAKEPANAAALVAKGRFLLREGRLDEALQFATTATKYDPNSRDAAWLLGTVQIARRENGAVGTLKRAAQLDPTFWPAKLDLARAQLLTSAYADAATTTQEVLQLYPDNAEALLLRARALAGTGDLGMVEGDLEALAAKFPRAAQIQAQLASTYLARNKRVDARLACQRALAINPGNAEAITTLQTLDLVDKQPQKALARADALVAANARNPNAWILAGRTYATTGDLAKAEASFRKAIDIDANSMSAYFLLSQIYVRQNRLDAAIKELDSVQRSRPTAVGPPTLAGMLLEAQGKNAEAKARYREALARDPRAAVAANNLAWLYAESDEKLDDALRLAQLANAQMPGQAAVTDTLGWVYYKRQLPTLAIPAFRGAIEKEPKNPRYHYRLGLAFYATGAREEAKEAFKSALALDPSFRGADDARRKLRVLGGS